MQTITKGPKSATVLVVGEAPGENEIREGRPFVGASGKELDKILAEGGIDPQSCRFTNVCHARPPKNEIATFLGIPKKEALTRADLSYECGLYFSPEIATGLKLLRMEIESMPNLRQIIGVGNTPLWALTGEYGITRWRGSQMFARRLGHRPIPFVPTYHPASILRMWENRWISVMDVRRARIWDSQNYAVPRYNFLIRPSFAAVVGYINDLLRSLDRGRRIKLAGDLETRLRHIACLGLATSPRDALCIPFLTVSGSYWSVEEECELVWLLYRLLTHKNVEVIGQNFLYDQQYLAKYWGFIARLKHDTMLKQHLCLPGVSKGLDFISSQHCDYHLYWKDESKDWDPRLGEEQLWIYNCKDAVTTYESNEKLTRLVHDFGLDHLLVDQMDDMDTALEMMLRGMPTDKERKKRVADELEQTMIELLMFVNECLDTKIQRPKFLDDLAKIRHFNPGSSQQVKSLAYDVLKFPPQWKKNSDGSRRLTADKEAITAWSETVEPLYRPLIKAIADYRSLQVFRSTFALADIDADGNWRCSINVAGPHTFRWSTGEDAFGFGTNMQNIPKGDEDE